MMNENDFEFPESDAELDALLDDMPLVPLPEGFVQRTMAKIERPAALEPFRISWHDCVYPFVLAVIATLGIQSMRFFFTAESAITFGSYRLDMDVTQLTIISVSIGLASLLILLPKRWLANLGLGVANI